MSIPEFHLSKPGVTFPATSVDNAETIGRIYSQYKGPEENWPTLRAAIERGFRISGTSQRFLEPNSEARVADYAVAAARHCLEVNRASLEEVDLVICGGIARQYFEPATATEVAAKLGLRRTHAFDVTSACVGHLEAIQAAAAYLMLHPSYRTALVCTAELSGSYLSYDIQSTRDLQTKFAGLTIGNAASCVLLRSTPWPGGGVRLLGIDTHSVPDHWQLCQVPINGTLVSASFELMRLGKLLPPLFKKHLAAVRWQPSDVHHFVFHQPSESMIRRVMRELGADPERAVYTHHLYGNTASASIGTTYAKLLEERTLRPEDRIMFASAAAGFAVVVATGEWVGPR